MLAAQKTSLRVVGLVGFAIFATFFSFTYSVPGWVEEFAADFIEREVSRRIDRSIDDFEVAPGDSALSKLAGALYAENQKRVEGMKESLKANVHERMADALAEIRDLDCECRAKYAQILEEGFEFNLAPLQVANDRLMDFIQSNYMTVVAELKRDIRIFTGSNAGVFLLLLLVSFLKPGAITHLFLPGALLFVATIVCSYFYVFQQNWLLTIIYSDYLGFMYMVYLILVFLFLCDIVFNKGRVTTNIINGFMNAIGSAATVVPC